MTAPTGLGQYNKPVQSQGDRIQAQQMVDRPILVKVLRSEWKNKTRFSENGGEAVFFDMIDLSTNQVYIEVMWMAGAIVDGLKQYAGDGNVYPVKVVKVQGGAHGSYQTIESLGEDPQWMNHVMANLAAFQNLLAQTRAQKEQEWAQAMRQPPAPPQVPGGPPAPPALTPAGGPPATFSPAGLTANSGPYEQAMALQPPHIQQALMQSPPVQQYQQPAPPAAPPVQQQQQPAQDPAYAAWLASQQAAAPPPPVQQQQPPQYPAQAPPAAVAPPQYQQAPPVQQQVPGPPPAQQYQQQAPPLPAQYGAPPAQQMPAGPPPGLPTPPGAVTGQTVDQLQQQLAALG